MIVCPILQMQTIPNTWFSFFFNVYLFLREKESMSRGGAERERETQNLKQPLDSELSAQNLVEGLKLEP